MRFLKSRYFLYPLKVLLSLGLVVILVIVISNVVIILVAQKSLYDHVEDLPEYKTAIVLGTSPLLMSGQQNPWFNNRMKAAADLYFAGKASYIILSGDNRTVYYNEPQRMRNEMLNLGVPDRVLYLDYAGLRTLDSMIRSREIFGQDSIIVVSQKFHNQRAVFLARAHGIKAIGFNAGYPENHRTTKVLVREIFARVKAVFDLLTRKQPRYLGEEVLIGSL